MDIEILAPRDEEADAVFALCSEAFTSPPEREEPWPGARLRRRARVLRARRAVHQRGGRSQRHRWGADRTALDRPHRYLYVYDGDDQIDGYVVYDQHQGRRQWGFGITVHELVAADARAAVTLWRHIGSHVAQVDTVTVLGMRLDALPLLLP